MPGWPVVFFFQAEDGIRDKLVTGVQTCALPIWARGRPRRRGPRGGARPRAAGGGAASRRLRPPRPRARDGACGAPGRPPRRHRLPRPLARGGDRKSVVEGKRGDLGGRRIIKKKKER